MITGTDNRAVKIIGMTIWIIPIITLLYNGIARLVNMGADMENLFMAVIYFGTGLTVYDHRKLFAKGETE